MKITLKKLIGKCVYKDENQEPWGRIKGVCFADSGERISSVTVETLSLIPICVDVSIKQISDNGDKKLILNSEKSIGKERKGLIDKKISKAVCSDGKCGKIKNMQFNFETGEITDIIIGTGVFRKDEKIYVNKTHIKDNTIYIE